MERSFKAYINQHLYNIIFDFVDAYIDIHPDEVEEKVHRLHRLGSYSLSDIEIKRVDVGGKYEDLTIDASIIVVATVIAKEGDYHYDDEDEIELWYMIKAKGDLECSLKDFECISITPYWGKDKIRNALTDGFVPIIRNDDLENEATSFLQTYYPEALNTPMWVNPDVLVKHMKLRKKVLSITADCSVFGRVYFHDSDAVYYDENTEQIKIIRVDAGTIFVDPNVFFLRNLGALNNTIIHECLHWAYHRRAFELERLFDTNISKIECRVVGGINGLDKWTKADVIEWQANSLTPRVQMPITMFKRKANEFIKQFLKETDASSLIDVMPSVIESLAEFFVVSRLSAKIRLSNIGYEEAEGTFIWLDNHYIAPHTWKKGFLGKNQTFSISEDDMMMQGFCSYELRESEESQYFVYVDSHLVLYSPEYVCCNSVGDLQLTEYARNHMDECCIVFEMSVKTRDKQRYFTECFLNRDRDSDVVFDFQYHNGLEHAKDERKQQRFQEIWEDEIAMYNKLPRTYAEAMQALMEWRGMDEEEIANEILKDARTVKRVMAGTHGTFDTLAAILLSMQIPPMISTEIQRMAPWHINMAKKEHQALWTALQHLYARSITYIREFLHNRNVAF